MTETPAEIEITDNEVPSTRILLTVDPDSLDEDVVPTLVTVKAALNQAARDTVTEVVVSVDDGRSTATSGTDYAAIGTFTIAIPTGDTEATRSIAVRPDNDVTNEGDETIVLTGTAAGTGLTDGRATITITDDDAPSTGLELSVDPASASEGAGSRTVTVTAGLNRAARTSDTNVRVAVVSGGTATAVDDYAQVSAFTITIPAGDLDATGTFPFEPVGDEIDEPDETVQLRGTASGLTAGTTTLEIEDDDAAPTGINITLSPTRIDEDGGRQRVDVTAELVGSVRSEATAVELSVAADTATEGDDYRPVGADTLTIPATQRNGTRTLYITAINDSISEGNEQVTVRGEVTTPSLSDTASLQITDDDAPSTSFTLSASPTRFSEGAGSRTVAVTARLDAAARTVDTDIEVRLSGGTATAGTDYAVLTPFTITVEAGQLEASGSFSFQLMDDRLSEETETVEVHGRASGMTETPVELSITDNDQASTRITLSVDPTSVLEDASIARVNVRAALNGAAREAATDVVVSVDDGRSTATAGTDYSTVSSFTITIPGEATEATGAVILRLRDDALNEGNETIVLTGVSVGLTSGSATITITDDDVPNLVLSLSRLPVSEAGTANYTVVLTTLPTGPVTVTPSVPSGTEVTVSPSSLNFPTADWSVPQTFTVSVGPDPDAVDDEVTVTHRANGGGYNNVSAVSVVVVVDDDDTAGVTLRRRELTVFEGGASQPYTVVLDTQPTGTVTVTPVVPSESDVRVSPSSLSFSRSSWNIEKTVAVRALDDNDEDRDLPVTVTHDVRGGDYDTVTAGSVTVTIEEDDIPAVILSRTALDVVEGRSTTYTARLTTEPTGDVTVTAFAPPGTDVGVSPASLTFSTSNYRTAQTFTLSVEEDLDRVHDPNVTVRHRASGGAYGSVSVADVTVTITDDDVGLPDPPTGLTARPAGESAIDLSWTAPRDDGGSPVTGYRIEVSSDGTNWSTLRSNTGNTNTAYSHTGLSSGTTSHYRVSAITASGIGDPSEPASATTNNPPRFESSRLNRTVAENSQPGTPVGDPLVATDGDDDPVTYSLAGADAAYFEVEPRSGQLRTAPRTGFDHEARARYQVTVRAEDDRGADGTVAVTVEVGNVDEPPDTPENPTVESEAGSKTNLSVRWDAPSNIGRPAITGYDLRYREAASGNWTDGPQDRSGTSATITGLEEGTDYLVQVRASNSEGDSPWSGSLLGRPGAAPLRATVVSAPRPPQHHGGQNFKVRFQFSEPVTITDEADFRGDSAHAFGGTMTGARRLSGNQWEVTVTPDGGGAVVVELREWRDCNPSGAICTEDGRPLEETVEAVVAGPDTEVVTVRTVSSSLTEGETASFQLRRTLTATSSLSVGLTVSETGRFIHGPLPHTVSFDTGLSEAGLEIQTEDDLRAEFGGRIEVSIEPDPSTPPVYVAGPAARAAVQVRDNDGGASPGPVSRPNGPGGSSVQVKLRREPLQLALWTDRPGYVAGETVRLYRTLEPHDDRGRYHTLFYLEQAGTEVRRYLAPGARSDELSDKPVDHRGRPAGAFRAARLEKAERSLTWEGQIPETGVWHFVMELRPVASAAAEEEPEEPRNTRKAWAKFVVASRSQLLNRRGFDREITSDLILRSDTIYYLGHQLFVHDGATLTIEPGTLVQAYGRSTAIIVEPGGKIVAEGTREAPVMLTCSEPAGRRKPGCWGGLRVLGRAPVTRLEGIAEGVLPTDRPVYGGADANDSSGTLSYVRVEFAGAAAGPEASVPAVGFYGAGNGTAIDHLQVHASLGDSISFTGGTAACDYCVSSWSSGSGLVWERGWQGGASHLYVQHGRGGVDGIVGGNDSEGHDLEPRSLPILSNVTLVHAYPYGRSEREAVGLRLETGSGVQARDLLVTRFGGGAIAARGRSALLFTEGESQVATSLFHRNGLRQLAGRLRGRTHPGIEFTDRDPKLRDVRDFANPDPRPKASSKALPQDRKGYIGAFGAKENWLDEWTFFGHEQNYDTETGNEAAGDAGFLIPQ